MLGCPVNESLCSFVSFRSEKRSERGFEVTYFFRAKTLEIVFDKYYASDSGHDNQIFATKITTRLDHARTIRAETKNPNPEQG